MTYRLEQRNKRVNRYVKLIFGLYIGGLVLSLAFTAFIGWAIFTLVTNVGG